MLLTLFLSAMCCLVGGGMVWLATDAMKSNFHLRRHGIPARAIILEATERSRGRGQYEYLLRIYFHDWQRREHTLTLVVPSSPNSFDYVPGDTLPILYDQQTPTLFERTTVVYSRREHWKVLIGLGILVTGVVLAGRALLTH